MNRVGVLLTSCAMFACPAILSAQNATLEICNKGPVQIRVAYAARIQLFLTGYRWETRGWISVDPGACTVVYDEDYDDAGPFTPQSGARVAVIAGTDAALRAFHTSEVDKQGWMQSGTGQICAEVGANHGFRYREPAGDPAANCTDGTLIPVAYDFMPAGPGDYTYTIRWDGQVSSVAVGKPASSTKAAAPASGAEITYFCSSTDKRKVVFVSDVFSLPDAGSQADNFVTFMRMQLRFQIFLITHYGFPGDDGLVACVHTTSTTTSAAEMSAKERSLESNIGAANKHMVKTGWMYVAERAASDSIAQPVTQADVATLTPGGRAALFNWVHDDVAAYLAASKTGFNAYKTGDVILSQGYRMWTSSVKPQAASGCWVVQGDSTTTMSCAIPIDKAYERAYYNELVQDVAASLPAGWSAGPANPFGGALPSTGYRSNNGAHAEVWLAEPTDGTYELHFQLVSAPIRR